MLLSLVAAIHRGMRARAELPRRARGPFSRVAPSRDEPAGTAPLGVVNPRTPDYRSVLSQTETQTTSLLSSR